MTNDARLVRDLDPADEHDRDLPCVVRHPDAGGRCERTATMAVYGMNFCPEHGEKARIGALMEMHHDAGYFFERFRKPHVPDLNDLVERELEAAVGRMRDEGPSDADHYRALARAYPNPPENVREMIRLWEADEEDGGLPPADSLLDSLLTIRKLMRIAYEARETWLVELLEYERQEVAAGAAFACGIAGLRSMV